MSGSPILLAAALLVVVACGGAASSPATDVGHHQRPADHRLAVHRRLYRLGRHRNGPGRLRLPAGPDSDLPGRADLVISADGEAAALGTTEGLPMEGDLHTTADSTLSYQVREGPEPGTFEITISSRWRAPPVAGTINGQPPNRPKRTWGPWNRSR
ncbi:MAG: hypothetical protein ACRDVM_04330 [Acidimicrobiia bacterium]